MTGGHTAATQEMMVEVDSAQAAVIREKLQIAKFLGKLLVESAGVLGKIEVGLITGDMELVETALHGSETHRKIFDMCAEVLVQTMKDHEGGSPGQKGYITGRIVFEAGSFLLPFTKAATLMQATKSQMLTRLLQRVGPGLKNGARGVATATKTAVDASQMCFVAGTPVLTQSGLMRIEDIRPGMWVWSRDEHSGAVAWKRVRHTFITHPTELYRLTYELRGPPESGPPFPRAESETLGVTAPHPFWVCNREQPAFIEAEQLQAGDELLTADGRRAVVMSKVLEQAPKGRTFTTYNFEVEDYHTYFAGWSAVWVHNHLNPGMPACMRARSGIRSLVENGHSTWDAFKGELALFSNADLSSRARLRVFNEVRKEYLAGNWGGGVPPWAVSLRNAQTINAPASSTTLGRNMKAVGIDAPWKDGNTMVQAHHLVPGGATHEAAVEARAILKQANIDINEAANGVFLPKSAEFADLGVAVHNGGHSHDYYNRVRNRLKAARDAGEDLRTELQKIANELVHGSFTL